MVTATAPQAKNYYSLKSNLTEYDLFVFKLYIRRGAEKTAKYLGISRSSVKNRMSWMLHHFKCKNTIQVLNILLKTKVLTIEEL